ncbi:unnamed protein product, partial [Ectocarpus sp. 13 AM-2016]
PSPGFLLFAGSPPLFVSYFGNDHGRPGGADRDSFGGNRWKAFGVRRQGRLHGALCCFVVRASASEARCSLAQRASQQQQPLLLFFRGRRRGAINSHVRCHRFVELAPDIWCGLPVERRARKQSTAVAASVRSERYGLACRVPVPIVPERGSHLYPDHRQRSRCFPCRHQVPSGQG